MYLSILPSHGVQELDPRKPIVSDVQQKTEQNEARQMQKRFSFSSPLSYGGHLRSPEAQTSKAGQEEASKLGVHLAGPDVLLPFVERPKEVKDLLQNTSSGRSLYKQLEALHSERRPSVDEATVTTAGEHVNDEWDLLHRLLTECDRDRLSDRAWLQRLYTIVFHRSPRLWCHLSESLGAREIALEDCSSPNTAQPIDIPHAGTDKLTLPARPSSDRHPSFSSGRSTRSDLTESAVFEVLERVPSAFRKPPTAIGGVSAHEDDTATPMDDHLMKGASAPSYSSSCDISTCDDKVADNVLSSRGNAFAGLRIRIPSETGAASSVGSPLFSPMSNKSRSSSIVQDSRPTSASHSRTKSDGGVHFSKQRRLSELFMSPSEQKDRVQSWTQNLQAQPYSDDKLDRHGRLPSTNALGLAPTNERRRISPSVKADEHSSSAFASPWSQIGHKRRERGQTAPAIRPKSMDDTGLRHLPLPDTRKRARSNLTGNFSPGRASPDKEAVGSACNSLGLLPDGRTRHPSAGSQDKDAKAALNAFRAGIKLSSPDGEPGGRTSSSASSVNGDPPVQLNDVSPLSEASEPSAETPRDASPLQATLSEPTIVNKSAADNLKPRRVSSLPSSLSPKQPQKDVVLHDRRSKVTSQPTAVPPLSSIVRQSRPTTVTNIHPAVSREQEGNKRGSSKASSIIFPVPPCADYSRVKELLQGISDEQLNSSDAWRRLCDVVGPQGIEQVRRTVKHAGERSETSDEDLLRRLASKCFGLIDMNRAMQTPFSPSTGGAQRHQKRSDLEPLQEEEDGDHEARLQAYYDDVDGYEDRWLAFVALMSQIWQVDEAVMHKVRQRCGPAARMEIQRSSTVV